MEFYIAARNTIFLNLQTYRKLKKKKHLKATKNKKKFINFMYTVYEMCVLSSGGVGWSRFFGTGNDFGLMWLNFLIFCIYILLKFYTRYLHIFFCLDFVNGLFGTYIYFLSFFPDMNWKLLGVVQQALWVMLC